jgi:lipopolysaccharide biosynthesis protein
MKRTRQQSASLFQPKFSDNNRLAIFVHWSKNDRISDHDQNLIHCLASEFDQVLVVCNRNGTGNRHHPVIDNPDNKIQIIERVNEGYDFGGYKDGMLLIREFSDAFSEVLLINNSIFLLKSSLTELMQDVRDIEFDVTSITSSTEETFHLQSYFLHFKQRTLRDSGLWDWFSQLETNNNKRATVTSLEIPFSAQMNALGYTCGAIWNSQHLVNLMYSAAGSNLLDEFRRQTGWIVSMRSFFSDQPLNPMHYMWPHLLELGCPFIKKDLVRGKVIRELGADRWTTYCESVEMENLIKQELAN